MADAPKAPPKPAAKAPAPLIKIKTAEGDYGEIKRTDLAQALAADAEVVTDQEYHQAEMQKKYGGIGSAAAAAGLGAARGLTFGLSDVAATGLGGEETRKYMEGVREANPIASGVGEVGGMLAPLALTGGAAAGLEAAEGAGLAARAARGLSSGARAAEGLGGLAARGAEALVGTGAESLAGQAAQKGASMAARLGAEAIPYGVGAQLTEDALGGHEITGEKLFAAGIKSGLFGAALGAPLGFAGKIGGRAVEKAGEAASDLLERGEGESIAAWLDRKSGEFAWRSAGGGKKLAGEAEAYAGGYSNVGRIWRDEAPSLVGEKNFATMSREKLAEAAEKGKEISGQKLGGMLDEIDTIAEKQGTRISAADVVGDIRAVAKDVASHAGTEPIVSKLESFAESVSNLTKLSEDPAAQVTFRQLRDLRVDADKIWAGVGASPELTGYKAEFKRVRDQLEKRLQDEGDKVADSIGRKFSTEYKDAKRQYQAWRLLERATDSGMAAQGTNRFLSLTDNIMAGAGAAAGAAIGGGVGSMIGSGVAAIGNRLVRKHGDFVGAELLARIGRMASAEHVLDTVDSAITSGVKNFLASGAERTAAVAVGTKSPVKRDIPKTTDVIRALARNPSQLFDHVTRLVGDLHEDAPKTSAAIGQIAQRAVQFLATKAPPQKPGQLFFQPQRQQMSVLDEKRWDTYLRIIDEPLTILRSLQKSRVSRSEVEALKAVYPNIYRQVQSEIMKQAPTMKGKLTPQQAAALAVVWDVPIGPAYTPQALSQYQQLYGDQGQGGDGDASSAPSAVPRRPIDLGSEDEMTPQQRVEAR